MALFEAGDPHPLPPSERRRRRPREQTPASRCPGVRAEASGSPAEGLGLGRPGSPGALSPDRWPAGHVEREPCWEVGLVGLGRLGVGGVTDSTSRPQTGGDGQ